MDIYDTGPSSTIIILPPSHLLAASSMKSSPWTATSKSTNVGINLLFLKSLPIIAHGGLEPPPFFGGGYTKYNIVAESKA